MTAQITRFPLTWPAGRPRTVRPARKSRSGARGRAVPVTYPDDGTMLALLGHALGDTFAVRADGELVLSFVATNGGEMPAPVEALDVLEARGWIAVRPDGTTAETESGRYWLKKWLAFRKEDRVIRRLRPLVD